ncbi:PREDICTED: uncharacterized protein LOC109469918 [Branchiostoma belcheri]|uniref:Uncharacterized protein LOC109469918 n=1 Tax=Branchiostoma belcheri TaxID=7741 RepID=A0A6P4YIJ8_BRABE|nr:PREDICTED: uncharacterized protein LOC109469918 [Branchiostoma belcheri]
MLRVCEKLREADEKGRRYGLARAETGYLRALVDAMADTDRLAEVEMLKTLGDVNVEKGRLGKDVGKFNTALALYIAAMVRCYHEEQADGIEHRYHYTERLLQGVSSQGKKQPTEDKETTTPAKVAAKFQALDKRRATGGNTDSLLVSGYAKLMVEAIVKDDSVLETEAIKSLGDVYLKRGTETGDTRNLTRATALYNRALARCHNVHGTVVIVHRLLHTAKIRQYITNTRDKFSQRPSRTQRQKDVRGRKGHFSAFSAAPSNDGTNCQVEDDISYRRYIQTTDRDVRNGDLDAAEQNLTAALKLVHEDPEKDWFFDSVTHRGFAFDGFMPWASKTPFRRDETKSKPPVSLIQTPAKLAEYQHLHIALAEGYHLLNLVEDYPPTSLLAGSGSWGADQKLTRQDTGSTFLFNYKDDYKDKKLLAIFKSVQEKQKELEKRGGEALKRLNSLDGDTELLELFLQEFDFSAQDMFDLLPVTTNLDSSIKMAINSAIGQA